MNSFILKILGKAELPKEIEIGHNYHISLEGSVTSETKSDNDDGTHTFVYLFKPIKIELLDPRGQTLKLKDPRRKSELLRGALWHKWKNKATNLNKDEYYDSLMNNLILHIDDIDEMYGPSE